MEKTFLIFGDSITYGAADNKGGWVSRLREWLDNSVGNSETADFYYSIYNLGVCGNNTNDVLKRFEAETGDRYKETEETVIFFAVGVNDSQYVLSEQKNRTMPEQFKANIKRLIDLAKKFTQSIIFIGLTPVDESKTDSIPWNTDKSYKNEYIEKYDQILKEICTKEGISFISILDRFIKNDYKNLLEDGLHPNSEGHEKLFVIIKDFLIENRFI